VNFYRRQNLKSDLLYNYYESQGAQLHVSTSESTIRLQLACACELQLSGYVVDTGRYIRTYRHWAYLHWKFKTYA
jgi:hypothetical protein